MPRRKKRKGPEAGRPEHSAGAPAPPLRPARDKLARPFADALAGFELASSMKEDDESEARSSDRTAPDRTAPDRTVARTVSRAPGSTSTPSAAAPAPPTRETSPEYSYEDRAAFNQAFAGVAPLGPRGTARRISQAVRVAPDAPDRESAGLAPISSGEADEAARRRLDSLVGRGLRFEVERDGPFIRAARLGSGPKVMRSLGGRLPAPEATFDLHGLTAAEVEPAVGRFLRRCRQRGVRTALLIHGKGLHSADGAGVLRDRLVDVLLDGAGAPHVMGFATAKAEHGGSGALVVLLVR